MTAAPLATKLTDADIMKLLRKRKRKDYECLELLGFFVGVENLPARERGLLKIWWALGVEDS